MIKMDVSGRLSKYAAAERYIAFQGDRTLQNAVRCHGSWSTVRKRGCGNTRTKFSCCNMFCQPSLPTHVHFGLCLFIITLCIAVHTGDADMSNAFQAQLRNTLKFKPERRTIRSIPQNDKDLIYDSRVDRSIDDAERRLQNSEDKVGYPDPVEINEDWERDSKGLDPNGYNSGTDYDPFPDLSEDAFAEMVKEFYRGPVCALVDVRNTPTNLKDLENCTVVNGFVQIIFMHNTKESDFEKYTFPKLRMITEYLLIYRVYGLKSLKKMFPNLTVIRGRQIFYKYGLVLYENPQLQEIGLGNLRHIERGGVRIQKNSKLCYLDTVDWKRLGTLGDRVINEDVGKPVIKDNGLSGDENCLNQCGEENECPLSDDGKEHCWGHKLCQQLPCPPECPNSCEDGKCVCHEQCLGGCTAPNNATACRACINKYYEGECMADCPPGTFFENEWRCISREECLEMTWIPHEDDGRCLFHCPTGYLEKRDDDGNAFCEFCGGTCKKDCKDEDYTVRDSLSIDALSGCTSIPGKLIINIGGDDIMKELEEALSGLKEIGSLTIRGSESLVSLKFFKNLKRITGSKKALIDDTYSLYVLDNQNLRDLFPSTNSSNSSETSLQIEGGKAFFHFNPKLCMKEIDKFSALTADEEDDKDISRTTNGDRATCDMMPLDIMAIEHMPMGENDFAAVRVKWENVEINDPRTLIGYQVFYKESKFTNATRFEGLHSCGRSSSNWMIKDSLVDNTVQNESALPQAVLHDLEPFTQYAMYVRTYTTSTAQKGAQSNITYFTTEPSKPSEPMDLTAEALNATVIRVEWKPPYHPNGYVSHYIVRWRRQEEDLEVLRAGDICNQGKNNFVPKPKSTEAPHSKPWKAVEDGKKCCTCDSEKILPSHEEEAKNNVNFEDFLHKSIFQPRIIYSDYGYVRKKRNVGDEETTIGNRSEATNATENSDYDYNGTYWDYYNYGNTNGFADYSLYAHINNYEFTVVNNTHAIIADLHHYTEYEIQVFACNHASVQPNENGTFNGEMTTGCSMDALTSRRAQRLFSADDIPAESFKVTKSEIEHDRKQPALEWDAPSDPNGYVKSYDIDIQQKQDDETFKPNAQYTCFSSEHHKRNLRVYVIPTTMAAGWYRARIRAVTLAGNGAWTKFVELEIPESVTDSIQGNEHYLWTLIVLVAFVLASLVTILCWYRKKKKEEERNAILYSTANPEYISLAANYIPDGYEVAEDDVELVKLIGHGNFGKVFVGYARKVIKGEENTQVAIKKLHEKSGVHKRIEFLEEAKLMKAFNSTHVVRLLGVVSQTTDPMVIMEYMAKGDLKSYLRSRRADAEPHDGKEASPPPSLQERLEMAAEIADGMAYLAEIKFVHRDLAARNCLVSADGVVKIGDFGLTRDVYETDYYRKDSRGLLPIRWMAPESLRDGVFDSQSDVWSYGVVLWEIATLAEQPYQGLQHDQVTRFVIDGGYMVKPKNCPKKLYDLMSTCWQFNPDMRPKFTEILTELSNDVTERFKEESYYYEQKRAKKDELTKVKDRLNEEELSLLNGDALISREGSFRMTTPINITPSRSRSETPCGCHTPASRYSNGSAKIGSEFLPHCDHLLRIDASAFTNITPNGKPGGLKYSNSLHCNNLPKKSSGLLRKSESFTHRGSRNPSPRPRNTPPGTLSRPGEEFYYSLSTGTSGIEDDFDGSSSEDSVPSVGATEQDQESPRLQQTSDKRENISYASLSKLPDRLDVRNIHEQEKPYAHMNGFKRHDSQTRRFNPFRQSTRRTPVEDESSYVESTPKKYFESSLMYNDIDAASVPPPPSLPPPTQPLLS